MGGSDAFHKFFGKIGNISSALQRAKPKFDAKKKRDMLRYAVYIHATDGYASSLSWGEIDPDFAATPVLVTFEENGKRLATPKRRDGRRCIARRLCDGKHGRCGN